MEIHTRVEKIRDFRGLGLTYKQIGERLGVTGQRVQQILRVPRHVPHNFPIPGFRKRMHRWLNMSGFQWKGSAGSWYSQSDVSMLNPFRVVDSLVCMSVNGPDGPMECWFDLADLDLVRTSAWTWYATYHPLADTHYCLSRHPIAKGYQLLHRIIVQPTFDKVVDHRDHNGLNNLRDNLFCVTRTVNALNRRRASRLAFYRHGAWRASFCLDGKQVEIGPFNSEDEARDAANSARNKYLRTHYPESKLQFPIGAGETL